jgi:hypothetical protein
VRQVVDDPEAVPARMAVDARQELEVDVWDWPSRLVDQASGAPPCP